jgi:tetratricopeptide (TPR) repeat protein
MSEQSQDHQAQLESAQTAYHALRLDEALEAYRAVTAAESANYDAHLGLARTLTRRREQAAAVEEAQRCVALDPARYEGHAALGVLHFLTDHLQEATEALNTAIALAPNEPEPHLTLAQVYADQKQFDAAHAELKVAREQILRIKEDEPRQEMLAFAAHTETYVLLAQGKTEDAKAVAQSVIALEEANPHAACLAYSNLGVLEARARRYGEAVTYLQRAFDMNPFLEGAGTMLGRLLILRGEQQRAVEVLGRVVQSPCLHGGTPHFAYAMALARVGRRQEAQAQYQQALHEGLRRSDALMARWQMVWLGTVGRYVVIGVLLTAVAAWVLFLKPSPQTLTLLVVLVVIVLLQRLWGNSRGTRR